MEIFSIKNLNFTYPNQTEKAINNVNLSVNSGDFLLVIGESGCGKTTLLKMLKPQLTPHGDISGEIFYKGNKNNPCEIGFIMQDIDSQIVTDKVYSELAFGLENMGLKNDEIRLKVSEFTTYFGISDIFHKSTNELSGGEKQLLNLASVMVMNPKVLILDEPTSQLDPIATTEFTETLKRINEDFGTTIIIAEHNLQEVFKFANKVALMEKGSITSLDTPKNIAKNVIDKKISKAMPVTVQIFNRLGGAGECPLTVRDCRNFLKKNYKFSNINLCDNKSSINPTAISCKDLWFRYTKTSNDVLHNCGLTINKGEIYGILGANGCGKSTLLKVITGQLKPYRGKVNTHKNKLAYLPQNPKNLFVKDTLIDDLNSINNSYKELIHSFNMENLLNRHPYDLSGGELQKAGILKIMLTDPDVILLDEPTKGIDSFAKDELGTLLSQLKDKGKTIVIVTHDVEFSAMFTDRCGLLFDGMITSQSDTKRFFANNHFYTTSAGKISRGIIENAVTVEDIVKVCKGANDD